MVGEINNLEKSEFNNDVNCEIICLQSFTRIFSSCYKKTMYLSLVIPSHLFTDQ